MIEDTFIFQVMFGKRQQRLSIPQQADSLVPSFHDFTLFPNKRMPFIFEKNLFIFNKGLLKGRFSSY